jgi:hypothetical protein
MLMNVEKPTSGGDTWFIDLVKSKQRFEREKPEIFEKLKNVTVKVET